VNTCISISGLGKKYRITHRDAVKYKTFRDEIVRISSNFIQSIAKRKILTSNIYEEFWALKNIHLEIKQGERIGIIGKNGAGKSTLLKLLSRITVPTTGKIELYGHLASLLEVGTGFHPELTGRENIYLNGAILGMRRNDIAKKFDEIIAFAETERFLDTPVKHYSNGMYVRLAFSVAAHLEPDILIIDEVLAVGDAAFQKKCLGKVREVGNEGRTILFVSHNMDTIRPLCQRGILLEKGKLIDDGDISSVITKYIQSYESNQYSIHSYTSREGIGGTKITDVFIEKIQDEVTTTSSISIKIDALVDKEYQNGKQVDIGIGIDTIDGRRIATVVSSWAGCSVYTGGKLLVSKCKIPCLPFVPGRYLISVSVIYNNTMLDCIVHCGEFTITGNNNNVFLTKRNSLHGDIDIPCQFTYTSHSG
jgi:lipopolysaccharide transport system ATP-binding protein